MARHPAGRRDRRGDDAAAARGRDREGGREGAVDARARAARVRRARSARAATSLRRSRTCRRAARSTPSTPPPTTSRSSPSRPARPGRRRAACTSIATCWRAATRSPRACSTRAPTTSSAARRRSRSRSGSAALVLFPLRFGASTAPVAKPADAARRRSARDGITTLFTAPTAYRALLREDVPDSLHTCVSRGRAAAGGRVGRLVREDRHPDRRRHRLDRDAAHLHRLAGRARRGRARAGGRCRATRRGSSTRTCSTLAAGRGRQARGARPDRLPLPRRPAPVGLRPRRLEPHRRRVLDGRRRLLLVPGAHRRHDHLLGLQHLRLRGRGRAARAPAGRRVRGRRRARRRARARRQGLRRGRPSRSRRACCRTT